MQTNANGDVILNIGANINKAKSAINTLSRDIRSAFSALKGQGAGSPQLDKLNAQAEQSKAKITELKATVASMKSEFSNIPTNAYQQLKGKNAQLTASISELENKIKDMRASTNKSAFAPQIAQAEQQMRSLYGEVIKNDEALEKMENSGRAFLTQAQAQPQEFAKANSQLTQEQNNLAGILSKMDTIRNAGARAANGVGNTFKKMSAAVASSFRKIRDHAKSSSNSASKSFGNLNDVVKKGFKMFLKYGLGVRSFFFLFRKVRTAIINAYKEMAKESDEVNQSLSTVKSSLTKLRNATAAAIQPLVTALAPVIARLANDVAAAMDGLGEFFAALTGQEYVYKAVDVQEDYAKSLEDTAENADKAKKSLDKYLSPLDDINRYSENNSDSDQSDAAKTQFTKGTVSNKFKNLADTIKGFFSDIFKPIKDSWNKYGASVMYEWQRVIGNIKGLFRDIANAFRNVWTNGTGERVSSNILKLWKTIGGIINGIIESFRNAWNKDALGESVIQSFIDKFNDMLGFIRAVADDFKKAFNDGTGERIWTNILNIIKNINDIIGGFWRKLTDAWKANDHGLNIWKTILGIVEDITGWFKDLSDITLDWVDDLDFEPLIEAVETLAEAFRNLLKVIGGKLKEAYQKILLPLAKWTFEKALPKLIELVSGAFKILAAVISAIPIGLLKTLGKVFITFFLAFKGYQILSSVVLWLGKLATSIAKFAYMHPYITIALALAGAIMAIVEAVKEADRVKWEQSDLKKAVDNINEYSDELSEAADNMKQTIESVNDHHLEVKADVSQVVDLKERLKEIIKDGLITEDEMPEYKTILDLLGAVDGFDEKWSSLDLQEIKGQIIINTNVDEVTRQLDDFFEDWQQKQYKMALQSSNQELYSSMTQNKKDVKKAKSNLTKVANELYDSFIQTTQYSKAKIMYGRELSRQEVFDYIEANQDSFKNLFGGDVLDTKTRQLLDSFNEAKSSLSEYNYALGENEQAYNDSFHALDFLNGKTTDYLGAVYAVESGLMSEADVMKMLEGTGIDTYGELKSLAEIQRDVEVGNNEAIERSNDQKTENAKTNASDVATASADSDSKIVESADKTAEAQISASDKAAANAKNNATKIENRAVGAFGEIKDKAIELWNKIKEVFSKDGGIRKGITNFAISGINRIIDGFNSAIRALCDALNGGFSTIKNFEIAGQKPFSWLPTITAPQIGNIPLLAQGAVLPAGRPFLAMLGDQRSGRNLEAPESLIRQIVREETQNAKPSNNTYTVPVQVGRQTLFTLVLDEAEMRRNQTGYNPFYMGG